MNVPDVGTGKARLNVWVEVANPAHCDKKYGCDHGSVASPFTDLDVKPKAD